MVDMEILSKKENRMTFVINKTTPAYANALRRIMLTEVPVMAIEDVEIRKNSSALYDEILAQRLGLLPLTTDLSTYELPKSKEDIENKKAKCTLQFTLKEKGPKVIYASDLKSKDPKVEPVYPKMPIAKLLKEQEIELVATAILGKGEEHAKWSSCHVWYNYNPKITINKKADFEGYKDMYPQQIFNKKGEVEEKLIIDNDLVDAVAHINEQMIKVEYDDTSFIFNIESWGQLSPKEILVEALNVFDSKLDELNSLMK